MRSSSSIISPFLAIVTVFLLSCNQQKEINLEVLLQEMINRETLTRFPDPAYTNKQFSSYDRETKTPGNQEWFANWDRSMFLSVDSSKEKKEYVMFDAEGPGAVVRFWMTFAGEGAGDGILRVYLDHNQTPVIEGNALDVLSGGLVTDGPLCTSVSPTTDYKRRGHNFYLPVPYASHCKITYESENIIGTGAREGEAVYYNINYRTYETDARVKTFDQAQIDASDSLLQVVKNSLENPNLVFTADHTSELSFAASIKARGKDTLLIDGSKAIKGLRIKFDGGPQEQILRRTILEMIFDKERTVWVPVGDFFGTGYQIHPYQTYYNKVNQDGTLEAYWVMPFETEAILILHNFNDFPVNLNQAEVYYDEYEWDQKSMHFGSSWHQYTNLYTGEHKNMEADGGPFDINYTSVKGKGVYAGDALSLFNTAYAWWGEGDEKIWVDQDTFPSHIGTGTEDYYGYAWCRPEVFSHPFIAQPSGEGNFDPGYTQNIRHRSLDLIPFSDSIRVDMEMWHWVSTNINFAPTAYFYLMPGSTIEIQPDLDGIKAQIAMQRQDIISPVITDGKIEGENMILDTLSGGELSFQYGKKWGFSNNKQLWWRQGKKNDHLKLTFISEAEGKFPMELVYTKAPDYGSFQLWLNGKKLADNIEGFQQEQVTTTSLDLGAQVITTGENQLTIKFNETAKGQKTAMLGIDYIGFAEWSTVTAKEGL